MDRPWGEWSFALDPDSMAPASRGSKGSQLGLPDLISLISRVVVATIFVVLSILGDIKLSATHPVFMLTGLGILITTGLGGTLALLVWHVPPRRVLRLMLVPDLVSSALLVFATGLYQDPLYPWMIGLAMIYGAGLTLRDSAFFATLVGLAYATGHIFSHIVLHTADDVIVIVFKAASIVLTAVLVGDVARRQAARELQLRQSQRHYHALNEGLSRRLSELRAISEITEIIHSTLDFEQVGNLVLEIVSKVIDLPASSLLVVDKRKNETLYSASFGVTPDIRRRTEGSYAPRGHGPNDEMFACTTILDRGTLLVVFCAAAERLEALEAEDRMLLTAVANDLTVAVENSELYKLTKRLAITDELTGLNNYRFMLQRLDDEIERARRFGRNLSLLMLDADNFKLFNDTHGHVAGDDALSELAKVMRNAVRDIDVVCRYGGEEFAILLPETDSDGAFVAAEKVREAVAAHYFPDSGGRRTERLTVSIGLSTFPRPAADREDLLRQADNALYVAKRDGRDRVRASSNTDTRRAPVAQRQTGSAS